MKRSFITCLIIIFALQTTFAKAKIDTTTDEGKQIAAIVELMQSKDYIITVNEVQAMKNKPQTVEPGSYIKVTKDNIIFKLPYLGRQMEDGRIINQPLNFEATIYKYKIEPAKKNYSWFIRLKALNKSNESFHVAIKVFKDGTCELSLASAVRSSIKYKGFITPQATDK